MKSRDTQQVLAAAQRLAKAAPDDQPADVGRALVGAMADRNPAVQRAAIQALAVWTVPEAEQPVIAAMSGRTSPFVARDALAVLAKLKTPGAARAAAAMLTDPHVRREAGSVLRAIGPVAEAVTIPHLKSTDHWVVSEACDVLAEIGGPKSFEAIKEQMVERRRPHEQHQFNRALDAIERRGARYQAEPAALPSPGPASDAVMRTWHDATRSFQVEAQFLKFENG